MQKILIDLIITNQCNKRCEYCDLDFKNKSLSIIDLDLFIDFIDKNKAEYNINFFGGEPLLEYEKIHYFVKKSKNNVSKFSIGTNGLLLRKVMLDYFKENNINIYLSVDNVTCGRNLDFELFQKYKKIISINFINDPNFLNNSMELFDKIKYYGFDDISFMPVFSTKKWSKNNLVKLKILYRYIVDNKEKTNIKFYKYYNGVSVDKQFILDTDMFFYSDLDSLLWLQKQYNITDQLIKNEINNTTKLLSLKKNNFKLEELSKLYNIDNILRMVFKIPKISGDLLSYKIIDNILNDVK